MYSPPRSTVCLHPYEPTPQFCGKAANCVKQNRIPKQEDRSLRMITYCALFFGSICSISFPISIFLLTVPSVFSYSPFARVPRSITATQSCVCSRHSPHSQVSPVNGTPSYHNRKTPHNSPEAVSAFDTHGGVADSRKSTPCRHRVPEKKA